MCLDDCVILLSPEATEQSEVITVWLFSRKNAHCSCTVRKYLFEDYMLKLKDCYRKHKLIDTSVDVQHWWVVVWQDSHWVVCR